MSIMFPVSNPRTRSRQWPRRMLSTTSKRMPAKTSRQLPMTIMFAKTSRRPPMTKSHLDAVGTKVNPFIYNKITTYQIYFSLAQIVSMYLVLPWFMFGLIKLYLTDNAGAPVAVVLVVGASLCAMILHYLFYWCRYRGGYQSEHFL
jgi:hypothetical protein